MLITTHFFSEDPLVQWLARGAVTTGRLRLTNSKVTGSNPVWVELFALLISVRIRFAKAYEWT